VSDLIVLPARRQYWARRINEAWDAAVEAVFETGRRLIEAKSDKDLPPGQFMEMVRTDLRFGVSTADKLMAVARDRRLVNSEHVPNLPPYWGTLYQIHLLKDAELQTLLDNGTIRPDVEREEIIAKRNALRRSSKQTEIIGGLVADLQAFIAAGHRVGTVYADPPWLYDNQATRSATHHQYPGMALDELCELPVSKLVKTDAHLHLWTTNGFLAEGLQLIAAWGFEFKSSFVWIKPTKGIGNYWRNAHELLLTAVRGDATRFDDHDLISWIQCKRGKHSAKPEQVRCFIERASPGPWLEMFARISDPRWLSWGHGIGDDLLSQGQRRIA
jgi:N6-adenosine-specific RNA methylase IME4